MENSQNESLLERAVSLKPKKKKAKNPSAQEVELAIAYVRGDVDNKQVAYALNKNGAAVRFWVVDTLIAARANNNLEIRQVLNTPTQ